MRGAARAVLGRRAWLPRWLRLALTIALLGAAILLLALQRPSGRAGAQPLGGAPAVEGTEGRRLFVQGCSSCHGFDAEGIEGRGPTLVGVGAAAADFFLRTGRMPLDRPEEEPVRAESPYTPAQIRALVGYVGGLGGPPIPEVDPAAGDVAEGQKLFTESCAGCHQVVARGGMVPRAVVPNLDAASPKDVAEAILVGPYVMPVFEHLSQSEVNDIARYVEYAHDPEDKGGWALGNVGPIPEGMVAWLLAGVALLFTIRLIGERTPR